MPSPDNKLLILSGKSKIFIIIFLLLSAFPFLALSWYNQPYADDFVFANAVQKHGLYYSQFYLYHNWNGRFIASFVLTALNPLSYGWTQGIGLPTFLICVSTLVTFWLLLQYLTPPGLTTKNNIWAAIALFILYASTVPDVHATLYWFSSQGTHHIASLMLVIVPVTIAYAYKAHTPLQRVGLLTVAFAATVVVGGSSELVSVLLGWLVLVLAAISWHRKQYNILILWGCVLLVLIVAVAFDYFAPSRHQPTAAGMLPKNLLSQIWQPAWAISALWSLIWQHYLILLLITPVLLLAQKNFLSKEYLPSLRFPLWASSLIILTGLLLGTMIMHLEPAGTYILGRCANVLVFWLISGWTTACLATTSNNNRIALILSNKAKLISAIIFALLTINPTRRAWHELLIEAPNWAKQCQKREVLLRQNSHTRQLDVEPITNVYPRYILIRGEDLQPYYNAFFNKAVAAYYHIDSVRVNPKSPLKAAF